MAAVLFTELAWLCFATRFGNAPRCGEADAGCHPRIDAIDGQQNRHRGACELLKDVGIGGGADAIAGLDAMVAAEDLTRRNRAQIRDVTNDAVASAEAVIFGAIVSVVAGAVE